MWMPGFLIICANNNARCCSSERKAVYVWLPWHSSLRQIQPAGIRDRFTGCRHHNSANRCEMHCQGSIKAISHWREYSQASIPFTLTRAFRLSNPVSVSGLAEHLCFLNSTGNYGRRCQIPLLSPQLCSFNQYLKLITLFDWTVRWSYYLRADSVEFYAFPRAQPCEILRRCRRLLAAVVSC